MQIPVRNEITYRNHELICYNNVCNDKEPNVIIVKAETKCGAQRWPKLADEPIAYYTFEFGQTSKFAVIRKNSNQPLSNIITSLF